MEGGGTLRDHLESARRQGEPTPELDVGPMPDGHHLAWTLFIELSAARRFSEAGPGRIPPEAIATWLAIRGIRPNSRLLWFITQLDVTWLRAMRKPAAG